MSQAHLAHHFDTLEQQSESGKLGMWLFLATEILLFGGLFCAYSVYRANHPEIFVYAHQFLDKTLGGINTGVLICSSSSMAWGVRCAQLGQKRGLVLCLVLTLLGGFGFLGIKSVEYRHKWKDGLLWGKHYRPIEEIVPAQTQPVAVPGSAPGKPPEDRSAISPAPAGPAGLSRREAASGEEPVQPPSNVQIFFGIYFAMTGLHAIHVIAGMSLIGWLLAGSLKGLYSSEYFAPVDLVGLYWHLVDLIWIFLFPLLYLIH